MIPLFQLILAHLLGDFLLQPTAWVMHKEKKKAKSPALYLHLLVHGVLILTLLGFGFWILAIVLTILHGLVDLTKLYFQKSATKTAWFFIDQLAHFISILGIWWLFFRPEISLEWSPSSWIYATALLLITQVAGIVIQVGLSNWSKDLDLSQESSLKNAGKYIGILERLFVFAFVILWKMGSNWISFGCQVCFPIWRPQESKGQKADRIYFNWNLAQLWNFYRDRNTYTLAPHFTIT